MSAFRKKIASRPNLLSLVSNSDEDSPRLLFVADCMTRDKPSDAYVCLYTSQHAGGAVKTLLGGGVCASKTADEVADNLLASMAQDIAERWNNTMRAYAIEMLESCLFLTQSSCAVLEALVPEHAKVLNLSQYLQKGGLKK